MHEVCHAMVLFPEVEGNRGVCTPFFAYHGGTVRVFDCQWPGVHRLYVSSCQAGYLFFSDLVWFHFSHMLVFFVKHDRFGTGISISYMLRLVFCHDCARLGEKKYRSEARMIFFSSNRPEGLPCAIKGKRLSLQVRSGNTIFLIKEKLPRWEQDSFMWR